MDYFTLTKHLSKRLGINQEIFQLEFPYPADRDFKKIHSEEVKNHHYLSKYEYWANTKENWRSIKLFFPPAIKREVIQILNEYLKENGEELIDVENIPEKFSRDQDDFNLILGQNQDYLILEIALKED
ncbi:hypothetical protein C7S20_12550 [Christiangramia fulva]|uniref:Uncharacterized protein n=1 Tax=Christiangramia fulva TaxID=2126553 RepID=A0A2R3Z6Y9_9FLAO|nr:hypothetical protein [Christiangramia fulva]AVR46015.1 hypothetical protein C7S20_12550 [Christiangramia fulva]